MLVEPPAFSKCIDNIYSSISTLYVSLGSMVWFWLCLPSLGAQDLCHKDPHFNGLSEFRYVVQSTKMLLKYNYKREIPEDQMNRKGIGATFTFGEREV